jgi:hypothetical protein
MPVRVDNMPVLCGSVGWHLLSPWLGRAKREKELRAGLGKWSMPLGVTKTWSRYVWLIVRDKPVAAGGQRVVQALEEERHHLSPMTADDLQSGMSIQAPRTG